MSSSEGFGEVSGPMKGFFWMVGMNDKEYQKDFLQKMEKVLSKNEYISGIFVATSWNRIEPEPGLYNWEFIDGVVLIAKKYNKMYKLMILPGIHTPEWVYRQGAQEFQTIFANYYNPDYGKEVKIPIPWDEIYLESFSRLIKKVGERYRNDQNFVAITLTGANYMYGEMHLPWRREDIQKWKTFGDYKSRIVEVYKRLLDAFVEIFPHQQICLHISPLHSIGTGAAVRTIVQYGVEKYPEQFTIQNCRLDGRSDNTKMFSYRVIMEFKDKVHNGFQNVAGWKSQPERQGSMEMTVLNFVRADAEYLELWDNDGADEELCARLYDMLKRAKDLGYERYKQELVISGKYKKP